MKLTDGMRDTLWLAAIGLATAILLYSTSVHAHDYEIVHCDKNLKVEHVKKLGENSLPNGLLMENYDRNGDGRVDIIALSSIMGHRRDGGGEQVTIEHFEHPLFYVVDLDLNGTPDVVYVDKSGEGRCGDIVFYQDLSNGADPTVPQGGLVNIADKPAVEQRPAWADNNPLGPNPPAMTEQRKELEQRLPPALRFEEGPVRPAPEQDEPACHEEPAQQPENEQ